MNKIKLTLLGIAALLLSACGNTLVSENPTTITHPMIRVTSPTVNQVVSSPLKIEGEARGNWYFEASFPAELQGANGKTLITMPVMAEGDWMTEDFVPFRAEMTFEKPNTEKGLLILHKDNPSGLPENEDQIEIPVRF